MTHPKIAHTDHPIHDLLAARWSPYALDASPLADADLQAMLEAARWAASSYNEQPWRFVLARRQDAEQFERALSCLLPANQEWARDAGAILLAFVVSTFSRNGKDNHCADHDLGQAAANLTFEATHRGLHVHQMAGIDHERITDLYGVPDGIRPMTAIAIGRARPHGTEGELAGRDQHPRTRKPLEEFVFEHSFGQPVDWGA